MLIVCPHCATSYQVQAAALGPQGREVRCARCRNMWRAMPDEDHAMADALTQAADAIGGAAARPSAQPMADPEPDAMPVVESPPLANEAAGNPVEWTAPHIDSLAAPAPAKAVRPARAPRLRMPSLRVNLKVALLAMGALAAALIVWRAEVVRALPQTAAFFRLVGLDTNLRNLRFEDVRVSTETVDGKQVLVIQGEIVGTGRNAAVEVPRLRFVVRDAKGTEIYGWNAIIEQAKLGFGERAPFRSRLASPPQDGHDIAVRFFNRRDLADGKA